MENGSKVTKMGLISIVSMYVAYCCSVTSVPNGAIIGESADFKTGLIGILLGWVIGSILVCLTTYITSKTGTTKDLVWREMFGKAGSRICSFLMAFCMGFWACFDLFNGGQALYNLMPEGTVLKNLGFCIAVIALLVLTIIGGVTGATGVKWISIFTVPVALVLFIVIYISAAKSAGGMAGLMDYQPVKTTMGVGSIAHNMVGMWLAGFLGIMDLGTSAKNGKHVIAASFAGVLFIALCYLVGQVGFIGTELKTLGDICASLGGAIFFCGNIFVLFAQANTTPACDFFYSNSFAHAFHMKSRTVIAWVVPIIASVLAFIIMYGPGVDFVNHITNTVSTLMGPLMGVTIAEFHLVSRGGFKISAEEDTPLFRPAATVCLLGGLVLSFLLKLTTVSMPSFIVIVVVGIVYTIMRRGFKMK